MSVRLKRLWSGCGAGSRWRTCTTITTTITADTFRDTAGVKTPSRPLFYFNPTHSKVMPQRRTTSRVWDVQKFIPLVRQAGKDSHNINTRDPEPSTFTPYVTLGISRTSPLLHRYPFLRGQPFPFLLSLKVYGTKNKEKAKIKVYLCCLAIKHLRYQLFQRPHFPESSA